MVNFETIWNFSHSFSETIKSIRDPEHPYTLEQLNIINMMEIEVTGRSAENT